MRKWYSIGSYEDIKCINCNVKHSGIHAADHHSMICPNCQVECIWYDLGKGRVLQIVPDQAPNEVEKFIRWSQREFDELEFFELIIHFEEVGSAINR